MLYKVHSLVLWNILFIFLKNSQCVPVNYDPSVNSYSSMKSFRRHQRSFPSYLPESMPSGLREPVGSVNRNIYRRSMYNDNPSVPPSYRQNQYDFRHKIPLRDVEEEYTMYPLRTRTVQGFDEEDQDLIHEEMGDDLTYIDQKSPTRYQPEELYKQTLRAQYVPERRKPIRPDIPTYHMKMAPPMKQQQQPFNPPTTPFGPIRPPQENYNFVGYSNDNMYEPITQHPQNFQSTYQYAQNYNPPPNNYMVPNYESRYIEPESMFTAETAAYYPRYGMKPRFTGNNNNGNFMSQMDMMMNEENVFDDDMQENSEDIIMPPDSHQIMMDSSDEEDDVMLKVPSKENDDNISDDYLEMENIQESANDKNESKHVSHMNKEKTTFKPESKKNDEATSAVETENINNGDEEIDQSNLEDDDYEENM